MNTEEEQQKQNIIDNFKRQSRSEALRIASSNKPNTVYGPLGQQIPVPYDLIDAAEKIYQWLIKDL